MRRRFYHAGGLFVVMAASLAHAQSVPPSSLLSQQETLRGLKAVSIDSSSAVPDAIKAALIKRNVKLLPNGTYPVLKITFFAVGASGLIRGLAVSNSGYTVDLSITQAFRVGQKYVEGVTYRTAYTGVTPNEVTARASSPAEVLDAFLKDYDAMNGRPALAATALPSGLEDNGPFAGLWEGSNTCPSGKSQALSWAIGETTKGEIRVETATGRVGPHVGRYNTPSTPWNDLLTGSDSDGQSAPGSAWLISHFSEPDYSVYMTLSKDGNQITGQYREHYEKCTTLQLRRKQNSR